MEKLLVICGLTATGKTKLALHLSKLFNGEVVSADSRQVYKRLDIGTGKEIPENFKFQTSNLKFEDFEVGYYTDGEIRIWGYDLVSPKGDFSVSHFLKAAKIIITDISSRNKLPIIVGGTGLYIKAVVDGIPSINIPRNVFLRNTLSGKNAKELFEILAALDPVKAASMNASDKNNPRRLVRAIEISENNLKRNAPGISINRFIDTNETKTNTLFIGLMASKDGLNDLIEKRVKARINAGIEEEIRQLLSSGVNWHMQSMQSLGYKEWREFLSGSVTKEEVINKWLVNEKNYAKHQIVWFKKDKRVNWYDISKQNWLPDIEKLVEKWHNN
jgi:tRNA dimethylallyltransferase